VLIVGYTVIEGYAVAVLVIGPVIVDLRQATACAPAGAQLAVTPARSAPGLRGQWRDALAAATPGLFAYTFWCGAQ
jgi:hypothetical protein